MYNTSIFAEKQFIIFNNMMPNKTLFGGGILILLCVFAQKDHLYSRKNPTQGRFSIAFSCVGRFSLSSLPRPMVPSILNVLDLIDIAMASATLRPNPEKVFLHLCTETALNSDNICPRLEEVLVIKCGYIQRLLENQDGSVGQLLATGRQLELLRTKESVNGLYLIAMVTEIQRLLIPVISIQIVSTFVEEANNVVSVNSFIPSVVGWLYNLHLYHWDSSQRAPSPSQEQDTTHINN